MPKPPRPTDAELRLLRALWELGPATVKEVHARLSRGRPLAYTAVLRMLQVMHEKGLVRRDERERSHVYHPAHSQVAVQRGMVSDLVERAFAGSAKDLVLTALRAERVSAAELAEIRALLGEDEGR